MHLADQLVVQSYHLLENGWTPLSQNPCYRTRWLYLFYKYFDKKSFSKRIPTNRFLANWIGINWPYKPHRKYHVFSCWKNHPYTTDNERGTVNSRVAFVLRSVEVYPLFWDLTLSPSPFIEYFLNFSLRKKNKSKFFKKKKRGLSN